MWTSVGRSKFPCFIEELLEGNMTPVLWLFSIVVIYKYFVSFIYIHVFHFKIRYTIFIHFQHLSQDNNHFSKVSNKNDKRVIIFSKIFMAVVAQMCAASSGEIHAGNNHLLKRMYVKEVFVASGVQRVSVALALVECGCAVLACG